MIFPGDDGLLTRSGHPSRVDLKKAGFAVGIVREGQPQWTDAALKEGSAFSILPNAPC
jgi:hypothetical protein